LTPGELHPEVHPEFLILLGNISDSPGFLSNRGRLITSKFREKVLARTKQIIGQMVNDDKLVEQGKEQERQAEQETESSSDDRDRASQH
jgi:hypothetical protein